MCEVSHCVRPTDSRQQLMTSYNTKVFKRSNTLKKAIARSSRSQVHHTELIIHCRGVRGSGWKHDPIDPLNPVHARNWAPDCTYYTLCPQTGKSKWDYKGFLNTGGTLSRRSGNLLLRQSHDCKTQTHDSCVWQPMWKPFTTRCVLYAFNILYELVWICTTYFCVCESDSPCVSYSSTRMSFPFLLHTSPVCYFKPC